MTDNKFFPDTYALVLCGGQSNRMGSDKSLLQYYDKAQRYHIYDMLQPLCEAVYISCSHDQYKTIEGGYNYLADEERFGDIGPMTALLTAFAKFPDKHMLMIGCDYPFLNTDELTSFSKYCTDRPAAFYNEQAAIYESMLGWYPNNCAEELVRMFNDRSFSLQQLLRNNDAVKHLAADTSCIQSVDTPEAFAAAIKQLNTR